jgi:glutathione synthase
LKQLHPVDFDLVFLRLPRPVSDQFLLWINELFGHAIIINQPAGIIKTSNKKFLLNFPELCPDIRICHSLEDINTTIEKYPIVLKPLREYGGKGILKIERDQLDDGIKIHNTDTYLKSIEEKIIKEGYLAMKFLKNVTQGDKRILVAGGEVLAASLRLPKEDSWLCNVSQGGKSMSAEVNKEELEIIASINPLLKKEGILIYGVDTLVNDQGERVLSEINTLSIGGWPQAQAQTGKPIIKQLVDKIFEYEDVRQN